MKFTLLIFGLFLATTFTSCKKDKGDDDDDGITQITTLEVAHVPASGIYGEKYTFKVQFTSLGEIKEYGIVYKPWIGDAQVKTPEIGATGSLKIPFDAEARGGVVLTHEFTMRYADFNDANYRAYAITESGKVVYGEVLYISFA